ncbi:hypothetical protein U9M48_029886 [Paspalum notatum var. saurae]|uniref:Uncharacterized protein n=1 Tax=Paspalum notatum var. saurae TaxID=547442 RepID=A0AAQ3U2I5_PASNO
MASPLYPVAPPFTVSQGMNKFTVIGCATVAFVVGGESENAPYSACGSFCYDNKALDNITDCSGIGCCQAAIPRNLARFNLSFSDIDNSLVQSLSPCSYGFIVDDDWFDRPTHLNLSNFQQDYRDGGSSNGATNRRSCRPLGVRDNGG